MGPSTQASFGTLPGKLLKKSMARTITAEAVALIKEFEGCVLTAYPDPGTGGDPWTIGYGHTGPDVFPGDKITEEEAEELLRYDLRRFEAGVEELIPGLLIHEYGALVSWAYNCGLGAVSDSTLRRRINSGEDHQIVIAEELPRWNKGGSGVMPGLVRRRAAEVEFAALDAVSPSEAPLSNDTTPSTPEATQDAPEPSQVVLLDFFRYFIGSEHQVSAVSLLSDALLADAPHLLQDDAEWIREYRGQTEEKEVVNQPEEPYLNVPYLYQFDSESEHGARMCFSSSNAMLLEYMKPGTLRGPDQPDDIYLDQVLEFGDTTSAEAQVAALASFGLDAQFHMDGTSRMVKDLIREGIPVPIGVLHYGPSTAPTGGGHWIVLVGFDDVEGCWYVHDPAGEMDVLAGGYVSSGPVDGRFQKYSYKNLNPRWLVAGEGDGWLIEAKP